MENNDVKAAESESMRTPQEHPPVQQEGSSTMASGTTAAADTQQPAVPGSKEDANLLDDGVSNDNTPLQAKYKGTGLWEQLKKYTEPVEMNEETDYYWPLQRSEMDGVMKTLKEKRILFIQSISEEWPYRAVQRLATVLQASGSIENLLIRITKAVLQLNQADSDKLHFGFWINQQPLPYPVLVFISDDQYDFVHRFLSNVKKETVERAFIDALRKLNLYIVCEMPDSVQNRELMANAAKKSWIKNVYAFWEVPVLELHLNERYGLQGTEILKALNNAIRKQYSSDDDLRLLVDFLIDIEVDSAPPNITLLLETVKERFKEIHSNTPGKLAKLTGFLNNSDDFISQVTVFCGVFFSELYYPDFFELVERLLAGEVKENEQAMPAGQITVTMAGTTPPASKSLQEIWRKYAAKYFEACELTTVHEGGNQKVQFSDPAIAKRLKTYIEEKKYHFFFSVYRKFMEAELITNIEISDVMERYVIDFFALAARRDANTVNAEWLKNIVNHKWLQFTLEKQPDNDEYDSFVRFLVNKWELSEIILKRIPALISGLLNNNSEYREVIKHFFRLLLNEAGSKRMAIIIAAHLYKEYRLTDTFPVADIISYFRRALNEANWQDSFFAYDALSSKMDYKELWDETKKWINDTETAETAWDKQFAWLYQVDYVLITLHRYFRSTEQGRQYELFQTGAEQTFPQLISELTAQLTSEPCISSIEAILENKENSERLVSFIRHFEQIEMGSSIMITERVEGEYARAYTLVADILEWWFYVLTHREEELKPDTPSKEEWQQYANIINATDNRKLLSRMKKYWAVKVGHYAALIQHRQNGKEMDKKEKQHKVSLRKRRGSLGTLMRLMRNLSKPV